ncbi:MAG: hypothetical protein IH590_19050 [Aquamicrobium sp.]|nr:hypothetical protein [Aquamicrobium sp.]
MSRRRFRTGRVKVDFGVIERFAEAWVATGGYRPSGDGWHLSRKSSLHRRKDGSYTLTLIWSAPNCQIVNTVRGLRLERP